MFFAKETGISFGCLSLWLVCAFTFFTVIYKSGQKPQLNIINWRDATHVKMTAAQVVETSVTANITWERGKKARKKRLSAVHSARFACGLFLAVSLLWSLVPGQCQQQSRTHPDDHNEMTPGFKIFSVPSLSRVYSEAPLIFTRLTFTVLVFSSVKHAPDKNQTPSGDKGK